MLKTLGENNRCIKDLENNILYTSKSNCLVNIIDEEKSIMKIKSEICKFIFYNGVT